MPSCLKNRSTSGHSLVDLGLAVFLLTVMALLIGNIYIIRLARDYNDKACREAVMSAAKAAIGGKDTAAIMRAAQDGLNESPQGGFFIEHPTFLEYKDEKVEGVRQLRIATQTVARVPAPILLMDDEIREHGSLALKSTYIVEFKNK
jgi:hypothetical protein